MRQEGISRTRTVRGAAHHRIEHVGEVTHAYLEPSGKISALNSRRRVSGLAYRCCRRGLKAGSGRIVAERRC